MLEILQELVRNVAFVVVLASVVEMLLPKGEMSRYVKLVMGLFVLMAVLTPVLSLLGRNWEVDLRAWQEPAPAVKLESIFARGEQLQLQNQEQILQAYKHRLEGQIAALARLTPGVEEVRVYAELEPGARRPDFGAIRSVGVELLVVEGGIPLVEVKPVSPILQDQQVELLSPDQQSRQQRVMETIQQFYGLSPEQVNVYYKPNSP